MAVHIVKNVVITMNTQNHKTESPYTRMLKDEIIANIKSIDVIVPELNMTAEFSAGAMTMKELIIKKLME